MAEEEEFIPTVSLGLTITPALQINFEDEGQVVTNAIINMMSEAARKFQDKVVTAVRLYCHEIGLDCKPMDHESVTRLVKQALDSKSHESRGIIDDEGRNIADDDYIQAIHEGTNTRN